MRPLEGGDASGWSAFLKQENNDVVVKVQVFVAGKACDGSRSTLALGVCRKEVLIYVAFLYADGDSRARHAFDLMPRERQATHVKMTPPNLAPRACRVFSRTSTRLFIVPAEKTKHPAC